MPIDGAFLIIVQLAEDIRVAFMLLLMIDSRATTTTRINGIDIYCAGVLEVICNLLG